MAFGQQKYTKETGGNPDFYQEYTTTNMYVERSFSGALHTISIKNDSTTDPVQVSFDGATLESDVKVGEFLKINVSGKDSVYIKATTGGDTVRIWGYVDLDSSTSDLPTGASTEATLVTMDAVLDTIDTVLDTINAKLVSGTVIGDVNLGATDNAVLDTIDAVLDTINAKLVTGTVIGDVNLGATDNAVLDAIAASVAIMDDWDDTDRAKVVEQNIGLGGTGTQAVTDLTSADTFYAIPSTAPTNDYQLKLQFDGGGLFYLTFENGGTAGTSGIKYADGEVVDLVLSGSTQVYVATKTAGDDCRWIAKEVV